MLTIIGLPHLRQFFVGWVKMHLMCVVVRRPDYNEMLVSPDKRGYRPSGFQLSDLSGVREVLGVSCGHIAMAREIKMLQRRSSARAMQSGKTAAVHRPSSGALSSFRARTPSDKKL